jgi:heme/copper-type cytochrome/quinol oxidase subunit 3
MSSEITHQASEFNAGRSMRVDHRKLGMWLFLSSEIMFFGGLLAAFLHYKINNPSPVESAMLDVTLVGINTFVLLTSSLTVVLALDAVQHGRLRRSALFLGATILLGLAFLAGQSFEFVTLYREGMTLSSSVYGSSFFTLTGFHGLHVLIGILWAGITLRKMLAGKYTAENSMGVEVFGLYWHFVDIVWIVLFTLIYLT